MRYGETGYNLEIDLTTGNIERVETDPKDDGDSILGVSAQTSRYYWDRVPADIDPFAPENILIFSTGLLCTAHRHRARTVPLSAPIPLRPDSWHIQ